MRSLETPPPMTRSWAALALLIVALAAFWPLVWHPTDLLVGPQHGGRNDLTSQFLGMRMFAREAVGDGHWPLWHPWILLGQPYVGNPQSATLYLPNWLAIGVGHPAALGWLMVLHQMWAGLGTYLFSRRLGCGPWAATLGGAATLAAPFYIAQIGEGHLNQVCLAAWIPWAFWAFEKWRGEEPSARWLLPGILTLAVFCGHVQEAFYVVLLLSLYCLDEIVGGLVTGKRRHAIRVGWRWIGAGTAVAGLSAIEVGPIVKQMGQAVRGKSFSLAEASQISAGWDHAWQLLDPFALGGPDSRPFYWETLCHFGLIPLMFAAWGAIIGWRRPGVIRWTLLLAFTVLFAMGPRTPIYTICHHWVPGVALFRAPSRMLFLASVLIAVLAAVGVDELQTAASKRVGRWIFGTLGMLSAVVAAVLFVRGTNNGPELWRHVLLMPALWAWFAGGCGAAALMTAARPKVVLFGNIAAVTLTTAQLSQCAWGLQRTIPQEHLRRGSELTARLAEESPWERVLCRHEHLTDDEASLHRLCKLPGYEPAPLFRTVDLFAVLTGGKHTPEQVLGFQPVRAADWNPVVLDLLGVRWMITDEDQGELAGWTKVAEGAVPAPVAVRGSEPVAVPYVLYRRESTFPRAYVIGEVEILGQSDSLRRRLAEWNPRESVLLERDVLPAGPRAKFQAAGIAEYTTDRVVLETEIGEPGYLVLSDAWFPGWTAADEEGHLLDVLQANHGLRAVPLTAGKHRITMTYRPPLWTLSGLLSLATAVVLARLAIRRDDRDTRGGDA